MITVGFVAWLCFALLGIVILMLVQRRSKHIDQNAESVASTALPEINEVAARRHKRNGHHPKVVSFESARSSRKQEPRT